MNDEVKAYHKYIRSQDFNEVKNKVLERDNYRCVCCNASADERILQVHHRTYEHLYDELNHLGDLTTLCKVCHCAIHRAKSNLSRFRFRKKKDEKKDES